MSDLSSSERRDWQQSCSAFPESEVVFTSTGIQLRHAREARGLSIRDIAKLTKIPPTTLDAIERNDTDLLSHGIFTRGFIRAYAAQVGLDPEHILGEYLAQFDGPPEAEPVEPQMDDFSEGVTTSRSSWLTVLALGLGVAIYGAMWDTKPQAVEAPQPDAPRETRSFNQIDISASSLDSLPGGMQLQIHPRGPCMISTTTDGRPGEPRLLQMGESYTLQGRDEIVLRVDDPGACAYWIDATPGRQRSRPGSTVLIRMVEEGARPVATTGVGSVAAVRPATTPTLIARTEEAAVAPPAIVEEIPSTMLGEQSIAALPSDGSEAANPIDGSPMLSR
jgi:transcriptional regulator with XRE-family HTH domain